MIYFDNASTTSVRTEVRRVYGQMLETCYGNPDSLHAAGRQASSLMEKSRSNIASMLHVDPSEIIFTSAASESNTLAIVGYALANEHRGHHVLTSNVEHSSVRHAMEFLKRFGFEVEFLPINEEGIVTPECLKSHMRKDTILVSVMHVNNDCKYFFHFPFAAVQQTAKRERKPLQAVRGRYAGKPCDQTETVFFQLLFEFFFLF